MKRRTTGYNSIYPKMVAQWLNQAMFLADPTLLALKKKNRLRRIFMAYKSEFKLKYGILYYSLGTLK